MLSEILLLLVVTSATCQTSGSSTSEPATTSSGATSNGGTSAGPSGTTTASMATSTTPAPTEAGFARGYESGTWRYYTNETYLIDNQKHLSHMNTTGTYLCTFVQGEIMLGVTYETETGTATTSFYVPADAWVDETTSYCDKFLGNQLMSDGDTNLEQSESYFALAMYNNTATLGIKFSNETNVTAGWLQWSITEIHFTASPWLIPAVFPAAKNGAVLSLSGSTSPGSDKSEAAIANRWWHRMSTQQDSAYQCDHVATQTVTDGLVFNMRNMEISALQMNYVDDNNVTIGNNTLEMIKCNWDYEKDDAVAVVIGSVQTGFVVLTLIIYLIYLKRRGPVKVPMWIIEPSMRNATVKPIDDNAYERKLSQVSGENGVPVKRDPTGYADDKY